MPSRKEENEVNKAFDDNYVVPMGPNVEQFERELEAFVNEAPDQVRGSWKSISSEAVLYSHFAQHL